MTALVAVETLLLVLLVVLVASLLRSHAEILRRLGPPDEDGAAEELATSIVGPATRAGDRPATDIVGTTLDGDAVKIAVGSEAPPTLLAFLTSGCTLCRGFWEAFGSPRRAELPAGTRLVAVTKDGSHESPARLRELRPDDVPVVMSTSTWKAYRVPGAPYFAYIEGGHVAGEGAAGAWEQLASLMRDAVEDTRLAATGGGEERTARMDRTLAAAGIGPGHPSLYPGGRVGTAEEPDE
jgi:hypothetical protein